MENERIRKAVEKFGNRFLNRVYTESEIEYCLGKKRLHTVPCSKICSKRSIYKGILSGIYY
ncbi:MAG: hypothetical protein Q9M89_10140 [Persephonella sp.]|nr:hypothetical protein [Persephonella sp.]